ncbi:hypothetical protein [Kitasatospora sp. LaBMicrA B282]|uniref:hypothetical protein n=1 Tax=Kitasatospora sp. LaBMicrA B282 TaxID=3420949 RepID=UPI003D12F078
MTIPARLVATIAAPLDPASTPATAPQLLARPGGALLAQRSDTELVALDPDRSGPGRATEVRFPAPWPRRVGSVAVAPGREFAVFAGVHAVRSVTPAGATRWEVRHGCWAGSCAARHASFDEYAHDAEHRYPDGGSVAVSADGRYVWAHVRGPLIDHENTADEDTDDDQELWLLLDAADGRVLGRLSTGTIASGSAHTPHPDPARMGLSVGEGEEGSPVLWGRWDGRRLTVAEIGTERLLLAVSPSGRHLLSVDAGQWSLALHRAADGSVLRELAAEGTVPPHPASPGGDRVHWDYDAAFVAEDTVVAGTSECDAGFGAARHWLVEVPGMSLGGEIGYPAPVSGPARTVGGGRWCTVSKDGTSVQLWELGR